MRWIPALLLVATTTAHAADAPRTVVLSPDGVDAEVVLDHVKRTVARPAMDLLDDSALTRTLPETLLRHPNECEPELSEPESASIAELAAERDSELYLALPRSSRVKDTVVWRWDRDRAALQRVITGRPMREPPVSDTPATVLFSSS